VPENRMGAAWTDGEASNVARPASTNIVFIERPHCRSLSGASISLAAFQPSTISRCGLYSFLGRKDPRLSLITKSNPGLINFSTTADY
jgi:hypothetical protein